MVSLAFFGWVLEAGNLECVVGWLAGFSMFVCNVFRRKKWGKNFKEVF